MRGQASKTTLFIKGQIAEAALGSVRTRIKQEDQAWGQSLLNEYETPPPTYGTNHRMDDQRTGAVLSLLKLTGRMRGMKVRDVFLTVSVEYERRGSGPHQ